jgi:hypothetical protein
VTGSIQSLDSLGIGFTDTTGQLSITNTTALANALADKPNDVQNFFLSGSNGFVAKLYGYLTNIIGSDSTQQSDLTKANSDIDSQIATLQTKLDDERTQLTNSFIAMLDAQSKAQSQNQTLTSAFFQNNNNNNNSCWVARAVYGEHNPRWMLFRHWLFSQAPAWFRRLYLRHGARLASWLADKPRLKTVIRRWMDSRISTLSPR